MNFIFSNESLKYLFKHNFKIFSFKVFTKWVFTFKIKISKKLMPELDKNIGMNFNEQFSYIFLDNSMRKLWIEHAK